MAKETRKIVILTGAGISAESGLETFRAEDGLWAQHRVEDVATPEGFAQFPIFVVHGVKHHIAGCHCTYSTGPQVDNNSDGRGITENYGGAFGE